MAHIQADFTNAGFRVFEKSELGPREDTILNRLADSVQQISIIEGQLRELTDRLVGELPENAAGAGTGKRIPSAGGAFGQVDEAASHISYTVSRMSDNIARIARLI